MAEVALTFENTRGVLPTEYSEVILTRRLYRSGDSEYLLNGTVCRLKDILDLFMDTGMGAGAYSVIELKMIEDILSENADDRRRLFEEAAGVTKYKLRRGQALRRLDTTQADLTRLGDLIEEVESRCGASAAGPEGARHQRLATASEPSSSPSAPRTTTASPPSAGRSTRGRRLRTPADRADGRARAARPTSKRTAPTLVGRERALAERQRALNAHTDSSAPLEAEVRVGAERAAADTAPSTASTARARPTPSAPRPSAPSRRRRRADRRRRGRARRRRAGAGRAAASAPAPRPPPQAARERAAAPPWPRPAAPPTPTPTARAALDTQLDRRALLRGRARPPRDGPARDRQRSPPPRLGPTRPRSPRTTRSPPARRRAALRDASASAPRRPARSRAAATLREAAAGSTRPTPRPASSRASPTARRGLRRRRVPRRSPTGPTRRTVAECSGATRETAWPSTPRSGRGRRLVVETEAEAHAAIGRLRAAERGPRHVLRPRPAARRARRPSAARAGRHRRLDLARTDDRVRAARSALLGDTFVVDILAAARALRDATPSPGS